MKSPRNIQFTVFSVFVLALFHETLKDLLLFSYSSQLFLYIMFIPLVSAYFLYDKRKKVFSNPSYSVFPGSVVVLTGLIVYIMGKVWRPHFTQTDYLSVMTLSALTIWLGGFIALYGLRTFKKAAFPLCFLFLMIPIPSAVLDQSMVILQKGSAEAADLFFKIAGVPAYREGFVFSLSNQKFEIAKKLHRHSLICLPVYYQSNFRPAVYRVGRPKGPSHAVCIAHNDCSKYLQGRYPVPHR